MVDRNLSDKCGDEFRRGKKKKGEYKNFLKGRKSEDENKSKEYMRKKSPIQHKNKMMINCGRVSCQIWIVKIRKLFSQYFYKKLFSERFS